MSKEIGIIISEKGQVTIPKTFRDQLGLRAGMTIVFTVRGQELLGRKELSLGKLKRWKGKGKLPLGKNVDEYIKIARDGHRS